MRTAFIKPSPRLLAAILLTITATGAVVWSLLHTFLPRNYSTSVFIVGEALTVAVLALPAIYFLYHKPLMKSHHRIRGAEERTALLFNNTRCAIYEIDSKGTCLFANRTCAELLGYDGVADLIGRSSHELFHHTRPDGSPYPKDECRIVKVNRTGEEAQADDEVFWRADGTSFPVEYWSYPVYENGKITSSIVSFIDITERKKAEAALQYKNMLLREMGAIAKIGGWEFDPVTGKGTWTEEVARIHGLDPDDETSFEHGLSYYKGESLEKIQKAVGEAIEKGTPYDLELELVTADGARKWVRSICRPKVVDGKVVQVRGSFQDVTERKLVEQKLRDNENRLRLVTNSLPALIAYIDNKGVCTYINRFFERWYGRPVEEAIGAHVSDVAGKDVYALTKNHIETALSGELVRFETGIPYRGAETRHISAALVPHVVEDGSVAGFFAMVTDITDRKRAEAELAQAQKKLIRSEKLASLGQLSAGVAHEIKNPLNIISTSIQLQMMEEGVQEETRQAYKTIIEQVNRAVKITDNLRDFARERKPETTEIDLHEFLNKTLALVEYEMRVENIDIVRDYEEKPVTVEGDPDLLAQVFLNVINNARDSMYEKRAKHVSNGSDNPGWKGTLTVSSMIAGDDILINFQDTGMGMTPEALQKVFDPFFSTKGDKGTGLGMSIAYGIIENHGGRIDVSTEEGAGTTFQITLPVKDIS